MSSIEKQWEQVAENIQVSFINVKALTNRRDHLNKKLQQIITSIQESSRNNKHFSIQITHLVCRTYMTHYNETIVVISFVRFMIKNVYKKVIINCFEIQNDAHL